ncbi:radical SAM protein [Candidatus Poribacteria bacterium]|nr:radical SAM protein [Candidatus Poribacteria bacterium]
MMRKILLVTPIFESNFSRDRESTPSLFLETKAFMAPVATAIIAALTPDDIEVDLWDEAIHGRINDSTNFQKDYNLVGITGYSSQIERVKKVVQVFRNRGIPIAAGGPGASSTPERYVDFADIVFVGEAELTWPQFITDWKNGVPRRLYRQIIKPDVGTSPIPRWTALSDHMHKYIFGAVQTTRGCPFDCEFCDVPYIFGHRPRSKPVERVLEEVQVQQQLGVENIFFCDDNFIGDPRYAKNLLKALIPLNNSFPKPLSFFTQLTLNVAKYDELLELFADANFGGLFIGIETPNKESLKETKKYQNYRTDILADVHKIQSYGMPITAGIIVGFDHDTPEIFDQQFEFLQESCIPMPGLHLLCAPQGTRLWYRLQKEGRLLTGDDDPVMPRTTTNIIPKGMTRVELFKGYLELHEKIRNWDNLAARVKGFISGIKRQPNVKPVQQARDPELLKEFLFSVLEDEARYPVFSIIQHTREHAPFMLPRVIRIIFMHLRQVSLLERVRVAIPKQIELESSPDFKPEFAQISFVLPESFKEPYKKIFPDIYTRVYQGLTDKSQVEESLIEIFTDFLTRWGNTFEQFEDYHQDYLDEICADVIAKGKGVFQIATLTQGDEEIPDIRKTKLADEILHCVEQEMRVHAESHAEDVDFHLHSALF